ncbi:MAG: ROK family protein [Flammeovirgaceae bacterium]
MSKIALSIYLKPTFCCIGFVNEEGNCLGSEEFEGNAFTAAELIPICEQLQTTFKVVTFHTIGLVVTEAVEDEHLSTKLADYFQAPVHVQRSGSALAAYEHKWGHATEEANFMAITIHSSIDGGIILNGQAAQGNQGLAGSIAHLQVHTAGYEGTTLGEHLSQEGLTRMALRVLANSTKDSSLRTHTPQALTATTIIEAALAQDELANHAIKQLGVILGLKLSDMVTYFSPKYFIISSFSKAFSDLLVKAAAPIMEANLLAIFKGKIDILTSKSEGAQQLVLQAGAAAF